MLKKIASFCILIIVEVIQFCKMQIACLAILLYTGYVFIKNGRKQKCNHFYDIVFIFAEFTVLLDGITAWSVNHIEDFSPLINTLLHLFFFLGITCVMYFLVIYFFSLTELLPKKIPQKFLFIIPGVVLLYLTASITLNIEYEKGIYTNYSTGLAPELTFLISGTACLIIILTLIFRSRYFEKGTLAGLAFSIFCAVLVGVAQYVYPEILCSSLGFTLLVMGCFINIEDPAIKELSSEKEKAMMQRNYYDKIDELEQKQTIVRHDTKHYVAVLQGLLAEKKYDEMENLLSKFEVGLNRITPKIYTRNRILNALFCEKENEAKKHGVTIKYHIEPNVLLAGIDEIDLISLFANLLDNALRAERECLFTEKEITVRLFESDTHFNTFTVQNHFSTPVKKSGAFFLTTKKDGGTHGIGLKNVERLAEKYGGLFSTQIISKPESDLFVALLCLPVRF